MLLDIRLKDKQRFLVKGLFDRWQGFNSRAAEVSLAVYFGDPANPYAAILVFSKDPRENLGCVATSIGPD